MRKPIMFRLLEPIDILFKVDRIKFIDQMAYASLVPYKQARTDYDILDETVGPENWQSEFCEVGGLLICKLGININYNNPELPERFIWKSETGAAQNFEPEKSQVSDSIKRAGFAWGIGRELYSFVGDVLVGLGKDEYYKPAGKDRFVCTANFRVGAIEYDEDRKVKYCSIIDCNGNIRAEYTPSQFIKGLPEGKKEKAA